MIFKDKPDKSQITEDTKQKQYCYKQISGSVSERERKQPERIEKVFRTESPKKKEDESQVTEKLGMPDPVKCVVCLEHNSDAAFYPCCHGGVCYECGKELIKHNAVCVFCRRKFWQLLKIEPYIHPSGASPYYRIIEVQHVIPYPSLPPSISSQPQQFWKYDS